LANIHRLSTDAVPASERLAYWNDVCMGVYGAMVVDTEPDGFQGVLTRFSAGQLQISSVKSTPAVSRNAAGWAKSGGDETFFSLQLVHSGRCRINHAGIETMALPGDILIADRSKSYELAFAEPVQGLVLSPPWARFGRYADTLEAMAGLPINVNSGPGSVLSTFIRSAWGQLVEGDDEEWPLSATDVIWDLLASVLQGETGRENAAGRAECVRREVKALIDGRLSDPGFQTSGIAGAMGLSARYLQMVFAEVGTTPSRFLLTRRLDVAAARLRRLDRPCSITDLALECGFNDLSYFSRAFRRRFGVPARAYRAARSARKVDWL
jgi:AraC family transcriptional activator of tynA and feaB